MPEYYVNSEGFELWTTTEGKGIPVILCSGGPGCCDYLAPVAELLETTAAQVIRYDARGCGRSQTAPKYSVITSMADIEAIRKHYGFNKWVVIGHSWGADLALLYALRYPQYCLGFVCMAGGRMHNDREWHRIYSEKRDAGLEAPLHYDYPPNMEVNKQVHATWKEYIQRVYLLRYLADLYLPALFIYGGEDIRPSWPAEQVAMLLPYASFVLFPQSAHNIWLTDAKRLKRELRNFIKELASYSAV